jgi:hypothetical protein
MRILTYVIVVLIVLLLSNVIACQQVSNKQAHDSLRNAESASLSILIIDRFEGEFVVCETPDRIMINIRKGNFPDGVKGGDVLVEEQGKMHLDLVETLKRKEAIDKVKTALWE